MSTLGIEEYYINDVLFDIPTTQDIGWPYQESNVVGKLVLFGEKPNQILFVYAGIDKPDVQPILKINEEPFCNSLDYLSPYVRSFVEWYFIKYQWKGYGLRWYE